VPKGKFIAMSRYIEKKRERSWINSPIIYLNLPENQEQAKSKGSRWKEIIKIKTEINELKIKKNHIKIDEIKN
jgi:hypothetical protein